MDITLMLTQYKIGNTYYGFDPDTKQLMSFPDEPTLKMFFPKGIDPKAQDLPFSPNDGLVVAANQNPGKAVDANTLQISQNQPQGITQFDPSSVGISPELWATLSEADKAFVESISGVLKSQYDQGQTNVSINQDLLNKALVAAQNDPNIIAKYGDAAKVAANDLSYNLASINSNYATADHLQKLQMEKDRKDLAEAEAGAGRAYSGFRKQAEELLGASQANIIQSSRSALKDNIRNLGSTYEKAYGSDALKNLPPISAGGETYTPMGGLTGTVPGQKQADIETRQQQIFNNEKV